MVSLWPKHVTDAERRAAIDRWFEQSIAAQEVYDREQFLARFEAIPDDGSVDPRTGSVSRGGCDFDLVTMDTDALGWKPRCWLHGAMNKVSPDGLWRCVHSWPCRAGCRELRHCADA